MSALPLCVGLDFGTTNSALALVQPDGVPVTPSFSGLGGPFDTFRSILYFDPGERESGRKPSVQAGPRAIDGYLEADPKGRLIQSIKTFAASKLFQTTNVFGRNYTLEELIILILRPLRAEAEKQWGPLGNRVVAGRPVRFAFAETAEDEARALGRIRTALQACGFEHITFEYEPVGAAYFYESTLDHDELVMIADFGGGTSDFSLLRVGPSLRNRSRGPKDILGSEGVGIAGDALDARLIRNLVSPLLGLGSDYRSFDKRLPIPSWVYFKLERWHELSLLHTRETIQMLRSLRAQALQPKKLDLLIHLVENDLGYYLHRSVQQTKQRLSATHEAQFEFTDSNLHVEKKVDRASFEDWIDPELSAIDECIGRLLRNTGVAATDIDRIFLTGGSSFVPAIRRLFVHRFGEERISGGNEFTSVAKGLALRGRTVG